MRNEACPVCEARNNNTSYFTLISHVSWIHLNRKHFMDIESVSGESSSGQKKKAMALWKSYWNHKQWQYININIKSNLMMENLRYFLTFLSVGFMQTFSFWWKCIRGRHFFSSLLPKQFPTDASFAKEKKNGWFCSPKPSSIIESCRRYLWNSMRVEYFPFRMNRK